MAVEINDLASEGCELKFVGDVSEDNAQDFGVQLMKVVDLKRNYILNFDRAEIFPTDRAFSERLERFVRVLARNARFVAAVNVRDPIRRHLGPLLEAICITNLDRTAAVDLVLASSLLSSSPSGNRPMTAGKEAFTCEVSERGASGVLLHVTMGGLLNDSAVKEYAEILSGGWRRRYSTVVINGRSLVPVMSDHLFKMGVETAQILTGSLRVIYYLGLPTPLRRVMTGLGMAEFLVPKLEAEPSDE